MTKMIPEDFGITALLLLLRRELTGFRVIQTERFTALSKQLEIPEKKILEGVLAIG